MGLLTDFYNTVARFFRPQEEDIVSDNSKSVATNRLKLVLMQDRTNLTPKILEQMRGELVDLLSKYLEMDKDLLELNFEQEGDQVALMLSIPVIRAKDESEIELADETSDEESEEDSKTSEDETDDDADAEFEESDNVTENKPDGDTETEDENTENEAKIVDSENLQPIE